MSKSFDRIAETYDATRGGEARGRAIAKDIHPFFSQPGAVFEIGIGTGLVALGLRELGRPVSGVDIGFEMAKRAAARIGSCVVLGDACNLPIRSSVVQDACSVMVLHLVDVHALMREIVRVLRPGGRYVVEHGADREPTPAEEIETEMLRALRTPADASRGSSTVIDIAQDAGLRLIERISGTPQQYGVTPEKAAQRIERRSRSALWDVDPDRWESIVVPAVRRIRALPEPNTQTRGVTTPRIFVFER